MKNLFFVPFAFDERKETGVNVSSDALSTYLKNLCVALISAKKASPNIDVALVTNTNIPVKYQNLLTENQIHIIVEPFDSFVFPDIYTWCLAFYKLCALEKIVEKYDYDNLVYTDADVFVQRSLDNIFLECRDHILLYDINHGLFAKDYQIITEEFKNFGIDSYITHYGGEFFAASRENAKAFITECKSVYSEMMRKNFLTTKGDEFITSIAAHRMRHLVKNAGAYIFRFWTGDFYLVSTCYKSNEIAIMHLPSEKKKALTKLFAYYEKNDTFPPEKRIHSMCHLNRQPIKYRIKRFLKSILHK